MFNREVTLITPAQSACLSKLITRHGKQRYQAAKAQVGIPSDVTLLRLSKAQAARLIRFLIVNGGQR